VTAVGDQRSEISKYEEIKFMNKEICLLALCAMLFALCVSAEAQQPAKIVRIGVLLPSTEAATVHLMEAFKLGLREHGYVEGQNVILERRYGETKLQRLPDLAAELVRLKVDVIVTATDRAVRATKEHTQTIPIVMANSTDPVGTGLVMSLARPSGNITGLSAFNPELSGKRLELLKEAVPKISRIAFLWNPDVAGALIEHKEIGDAARLLKLSLQAVVVRRMEDIESALAAIIRERADAFILMAQNPVLFGNRSRIVDFGAKKRLPAMYAQKEFVDVGGLMAYGPNLADLYRRAATYVDKILNGRKPGDLPVEQPTKFEFIINLKAAKQIGLTIPPNVLSRADRIIKRQRAVNSEQLAVREREKKE